MLVAAKLKAEKIEARNFPFNKELKCTCFDNVCCCCYYMFRLFFVRSRLFDMFFSLVCHALHSPLHSNSK